MNWQVVGQQRFAVQEDLVAWDAQGDLTADELIRILGAGLVVQAEYGYALFLIAMVGPWSFPPAARRALAEFHRQHKAVGATAVVGITPTMRMLVDLVLRAVALFSGRRPHARFFRTHAEGQVWLSEQRELGKQGLLVHERSPKT